MGCQDLFEENDIFGENCSDALSVLGPETSWCQLHAAGPRTTVPEHNHSMSPLTMAARLAVVSEKLRNDKQMFSNHSIHVLRIKQVLLSSRYETEQ